MASKRSRAAFETDLSYVGVGTPLPPDDPDTRDDGSFVPVWQQEARDERGRKRFHGAFTGGFSAGYHNTVGSKQGWAPTAFVSTRDRQAEQLKQRQRVEDFMDEEDLADLNESHQVRIEGSFAGLGSLDSASSADTVMDLFRPSDADTVGSRLLQKMGWRPGQGVGRRIKRKARLGEDDEDDVDAETLHFAPEDTKMIGFVRKDDFKGLGFKGEGNLNQPGDVADDDASLLAASKSRMLKAKEKSKKASFGVGVLNDTGSDEEDPYELGPKLTFNRSIGTGKKPKKATEPPKLTRPNPSIGPRPVNRSTKILAQQSAVRLRRTHDGKFPLTGFILSSKGPPTTLTKSYPPPPIPETWKPSKQHPSANPLQRTPWQSTADAAKSSTLTPAQRGSLLAEPQLPTQSVFAYLTPAARAKIASATGNPNLPPAGSQEAAEAEPQPPPPQPQPEPSTHSSAQTQWSLIPPLSPKTAQAALFRARATTDSTTAPYATDPDKAKRYITYLEFSAGVRASPPERGQMGEEEWVREIGEFGKVAGLGRLGGLMAGRFSAASARTRVAGEERGGDDNEDRTSVAMHDGLARTVEKFFPTRLLCKRFNVKAPAHVLDPGAEVGGELAGAKVEEPVGKREIEKMMMFGTTQGLGSGVDGDGGLPLKMKELAVVDPEKNEAIEKERPPMEVFKAIFGEDEDEE